MHTGQSAQRFMDRTFSGARIVNVGIVTVTFAYWLCGSRVIEASIIGAVLNESRAFIDAELSSWSIGTTNASNYWLEPISGLEFHYANNELMLKYDPNKKSENAMQRRERGEKIEGTLTKIIGSFMMMIPIGLQLLRLPIELATIKVSLLRSLLIAKVTLFILLLRHFPTHKEPQQIVYVRVPPKEVHEHFYHPLKKLESNRQESWFENHSP